MADQVKRVCAGLVAHVDAGKTTCTEAMLYLSGAIRKAGRVDHGDAVLDYDAQERGRGITIYAKEAFFTWNDTEFYLIDTPGHVDFSSEMERSLQVLDLAVMVVSGSEGVQTHTETIWNCLKHYQVPCVIFVNKMDISFKEKTELLEDLKKHCSPNCIDFAATDRDDALALVNEEMMEEYLETGTVSREKISEAVYRGECVPVVFGSALKMDGVKELMDLMADYSLDKEWPEEFGARVYKISSDESGNRLTHMKITGGSLKAKDMISEEDKADQVRIYNGKQFKAVNEAYAGMIAVVKGPEHTFAGQGLGYEEDSEPPVLGAFMNYRLLLPDGVDALEMMNWLNRLADEDPQLKVSYEEKRKRIHVRIMGPMQMEVLQKRIEDISGVKVGFGTGEIVYRETIAETVKGYGHFEPLRHYAEVHVRLEPLPAGSGIVVVSEAPADELPSHWQKSILAALSAKEHRGVLTGSPLTDVKIILTAGKGNLKHTEGGDFRQAACRAVRQGLMKAENVLLEPYYEFSLSVPAESAGKALYDLETKEARSEITDLPDGSMLIKGKGPVRTLVNYQNEVTSYTRGRGRFTASASDYEPVSDPDPIVEAYGYDPETDFRNPTGSVFCAHGAGYYVPFDEVEPLLHLPTDRAVKKLSYSAQKISVGTNELDSIFEGLGGNNKKASKHYKPKKKDEDASKMKPSVHKDLPTCLIVDGYNMIYAWEPLKQLSREDLSAARVKLIDQLASYAGYKGYKLIIVFDGYKVKDNPGTNSSSQTYKVIYTPTSQTADAYIEKTVHDLRGQYFFIVASSDALIQTSVLASDAVRMSARELQMGVEGMTVGKYGV